MIELFRAIGKHKTGNSSKSKISKIQTLLGHIQNINDVDMDGNTPLHVAVSRGHQDVVELLINKGANVNYRNSQNESPLDIAKSSNSPHRQEIVDILEAHLNSLSKINKKLKEFVENVVYIYESSLSEYCKRLEDKIGNPGKLADCINKLFEIGKGGTEGTEEAKIKTSSLVAINVLQHIVSSVGSWHNRKILKRRMHQLYIFKKNPDRVRKELVKSGVEIFQSFESQFDQVTADGSWERAMAKLAEDVVDRIINYKTDNEEFSTFSIIKGVLLGKSKTYKHTSTDMPHFKPGHSLKDKISNLWNTAELFNEVGLVTSNGITVKYYKKRKSGTSKYGYRLLFEWESEDQLQEYQEENKPTIKEYKYILKSLSKKTREELEKALLDEINNKDPKLMEDRLKEKFKEGMEQMKQDAEESFNELEEYVSDNFDKLLVYIENHQNELKNHFNKIEQQNKEANQQRQEIAVGVANANHGINNLGTILDELREKVAERLGKKENRKPVWFNVIKSVRLFTGRSEKLTNLHKALQSESAQAVISQTAVITGLGGIGKSELARKYASDFRKYYNDVIWINAETEEDLRKSFQGLAKELEIPITEKRVRGTQERNIKSIVEDVYKYFTNERSLFIFDNAEENRDIKEFLPLSLHPDAKKPHILITSRNQDWEVGEEGKVEVIKLKEFSPEEAVKFVKEFLEVKDSLQDENIKELTEELQYFPLALRQAVVYTQQKNKEAKRRGDKAFEIRDYLEAYQRQTTKLLDEGYYKQNDRYTKTVLTTWEVTLNKISNDQENGKQAIHILNIMAYLLPDNVKIEELFLKLVGDIDKLWKAVELLDLYSMISLNEGVSNIHRLVQQVTREKFRNREEVVLKEALKLFKGNVNLSNIDHAITVWNCIGKYEGLVKEFGELPNQIVSKLDNSIRYEEAHSFGTKALELLKSISDFNYFHTLENTIADLLRKQGKYEEAIEAFEKVLKERKKLGFNHPDTLLTMRNIAYVIYKQGKYDEALGKYEEILKIDKEDLSTLCVKAEVLNNKGKYDEALKICNEVIDKKKVRKLNFDDVMHERARALDNLGLYRDAIEAFKKALESRKENISDPDHYSIRYTRHGLGRALSNQGMYEEALETYKKALAEEEKLGLDNPDRLATKNGIAVVFVKQGKYDEALVIYKEVLERRMKVLGENHPSTLYTLHGMAKVFNIQGKYDEALKKYEKVLEERKKILGKHQPSTLSTMHEIATVYSNQQKYDEAITKYEEVLEKRENVLGKNHPSTLSTRNGIAEVLKKQDKYDEALEIFQEVYDKRKEKIGEDHPGTLATWNGLGEVLEKQGKNKEALKIFKAVYGKRKEKLGENHPDTRETERNIDRVESSVFL